jgi:hypothetical protein
MRMMPDVGICADIHSLNHLAETWRC